MRYRLELTADYEFTVRNLETDAVAGSVTNGLGMHPDRPGRLVRTASVRNRGGDLLATVTDLTVPSPLRVASVAVANHEVHRGYPSLQAATAGTAEPLRIELLLGTVLADIVREYARAFIERSRGGK